MKSKLWNRQIPSSPPPAAEVASEIQSLESGKQTESIVEIQRFGGGMVTATKRLQNQVTGNAGLYYCSYRLSLLGWNVMPTSRNARGVDIIAYNADASQFVGIQ